MNICIVGHGPSLIGANQGTLIDSHDVIVRLKGCQSTLGTDDYGKRVDHLCMTTEVPGLAFKVIAGSYWFYPKNGDYDRISTFETVAEVGAPFMIPLRLCNHWNEQFRALNPTFPNVSTGTAAIIIAAHYYEPEEIVLAGFDSVFHGKPFDRNPGIPRTGVGEIKHDWDMERHLLKSIEFAYNTVIRSIE